MKTRFELYGERQTPDANQRRSRTATVKRRPLFIYTKLSSLVIVVKAFKIPTSTTQAGEESDSSVKTFMVAGARAGLRSLDKVPRRT